MHMDKTKRIAIVRTDSLDKALSVLKAHYGLTASGVVRMLVAREVERINSIVQNDSELGKKAKEIK
jgi:hypothetical protein|tara:strand:+ start:1216 stop:1413 length:198 start_codon:yes stop_codon:yes gene_type:complete